MSRRARLWSRRIEREAVRVRPSGFAVMRHPTLGELVYVWAAWRTVHPGELAVTWGRRRPPEPPRLSNVI